MIYVFIKFFSVPLIIIVIAVFILGFWRTWQIQHDDREIMFLKGTVPDPLPDGFYKGTVSDREFSWLGKKFDADKLKGINVFDNGSKLRNEKYPFIVYSGKGLLNKNLELLKINYNISENPWWIRLILDEIVQVAPNEYLGKAHIRIIPGFPFTITFFKLKKE